MRHSRKDYSHLKTLVFAKFKEQGYISFHQALALAEQTRIRSKRSVLRLLYKIPNSQRLFFWVDDKNEFINSLNLSPPNRRTMIVTRPKSEFGDIILCEYNVSNRLDYKSVMANLTRRDYKRTKHFPPALNQYFIKKSQDRKYIYWSESDCQVIGNAGEVESMPLGEELLE